MHSGSGRADTRTHDANRSSQAVSDRCNYDSVEFYSVSVAGSCYGNGRRKVSKLHDGGNAMILQKEAISLKIFGYLCNIKDFVEKLLKNYLIDKTWS